MKRIVPIALALSLALSISPALAASQDTTIQAAYRDVTIVADGVPIVPRDASGAPVEPFLYNGTTYLPVRAVADALGVGVAWDQATYTVRLTSGAERTAPAGPAMTTHRDKSIGISYRDVKLEVDGKLITPRDASGNVVEPFLYGGTTYLPVRAVADAMDVDVSWDQETYTVYLGQKLQWVPTRSYCKLADGRTANDVVYTYDSKGRLTSESGQPGADEPAYTYTYGYDAQDQLIRRTYRDADTSYVQTFTYDAAGHQTSFREEIDGTWDLYEYYWDASGRQIWERHTNPEGEMGYDTYTYDAAKGQVVHSVTYRGALLYETTSTYDRHGNCVKEVTVHHPAFGDTATTTTERSFTASGDPLTEVYTYANGTTTTKTWSYANAGQLMQLREVTVTNGRISNESIDNYTYDREGRIATLTLLSNGRTISSAAYTYDQGNNPVRVVYDDAILYHAYDQYGNQIKSWSGDGDGPVTYSEYQAVPIG